jgi:hypothetical protein
MQIFFILSVVFFILFSSFFFYSIYLIKAEDAEIKYNPGLYIASFISCPLAIFFWFFSYHIANYSDFIFYL